MVFLKRVKGSPSVDLGGEPRWPAPSYLPYFSLLQVLGGRPLEKYLLSTPAKLHLPPPYL